MAIAKMRTISDGMLSSSDGKWKTQRKQQKVSSDEPTVHFLDAPDECQK
jgi:hypothetical protein